jgi:hypothetical protein
MGFFFTTTGRTTVLLTLPLVWRSYTINHDEHTNTYNTHMIATSCGGDDGSVVQRRQRCRLALAAASVRPLPRGASAADEQLWWSCPSLSCLPILVRARTNGLAPAPRHVADEGALRLLWIQRNPEGAPFCSPPQGMPLQR